MERDEARVLISRTLENQLIEWANSYYQVTTCRLILKAFNEPVTRIAINNGVNAECNSMLRKVTKFKEYMLEDSYEYVCQMIQDLKQDTQNTIIKTLTSEGGILL